MGAGISPNPVSGTIGGTGVTSGSASATVTANGTVGAYQVVVSASGASPSVAFHLANAASLTGISPPSGATTGGGMTTITGHGFGTSAANVAVMFGDASATIRSVTDTTIMVTAPAHSTGTVDVVATVNGAPGALTQGYTYGVVNPLPIAQPTSGAVAPVGPLPAPRPVNTALATAPNPLPSPR